ncbi:hypothetical protein [Ascidiimonas sp. W6]|uniref:hypothetical protein n=1 Tax=Ascidiimonas meishanensis TaxID=3128903 RepID=UPI0030EC729C
MKFQKLFLVLMLTSVMGACYSDDDNGTEEISEALAVLNTEILEYSLGTFGIEEGASIRVQALNYEISELVRQEDGEILYRYKAKENFAGLEYVELKSARGSNGSSENNDITITKLTILVQ